jgi:hypothetical protein
MATRNIPTEPSLHSFDFEQLAQFVGKRIAPVPMIVIEPCVLELIVRQ